MTSWTSELPSVDAASRISEEEITEEISTFRCRVTNLKNKVARDVDDEFRESVSDFLKVSSLQIEHMHLVHVYLSKNSLCIFKNSFCYSCNSEPSWMAVTTYVYAVCFVHLFRDHVFSTKTLTAVNKA